MALISLSNKAHSKQRNPQAHTNHSACQLTSPQQRTAKTVNASTGKRGKLPFKGNSCEASLCYTHTHLLPRSYAQLPSSPKLRQRKESRWWGEKASLNSFGIKTIKFTTKGEIT